MTIGWISRHQMTTEQKEDLVRIVGGQITLKQISHTINDINEILPLLDEVDIIAAVLPPKLLCDLVNACEDKRIIQAVSKRQATGNIITLSDGRQEEDFKFVHSHWEEIIQFYISVNNL